MFLLTLPPPLLSRFVSNNCNSKTSGRGEFTYFLMKTLYVLVFVFLSSSGLYLVYLAVVVLGAFAMFEFYSFNMSHNNHIIAKCTTAQHAVHCWTALCLVLAVISYNF